MTVRDIIRAIQREVRDTDVQPARASELSMQLSALLGNVLDELLQADMAYNAVLLQCMDKHEAANRAKIEAMTTPEYARFKEAKNAEKAVVSLAATLKAYVRAKGDEMRLG